MSEPAIENRKWGGAKIENPPPLVNAPAPAVFAALRQTIRRHEIPIKPFDDLIRAFEQDQVVLRYQSFPQLA